MSDIKDFLARREAAEQAVTVEPAEPQPAASTEPEQPAPELKAAKSSEPVVKEEVRKPEPEPEAPHYKSHRYRVFAREVALYTRRSSFNPKRRIAGHHDELRNRPAITVKERSQLIAVLRATSVDVDWIESVAGFTIFPI